MSADVFDVGIIGGGVIGLSCAWRLAQSGARVAVFERGEVGREASWAAAGMLAAQCEAAHYPPAESGSIEYSKRQAMFDLCLQSRALYAAFADELFDATGVDIELSIKGHKRNDWRTPGILYVQTRDDDTALANFAQQKEQGLSVESTPDFRDFPSAWLPQEGQVENRKLIEALRQAAAREGVVFFENEVPLLSQEALRGVDFRKSSLPFFFKIAGAGIGKRFVSFDKTLLCAGAWSYLREPWFGQARVKPICGQMAVVKNDKKLSRIVYGSDVYLVPRRDGRLLIGATMENTGLRKQVTPRGLTTLFSAARRIVPELDDCAVIDQWAGLRPKTVDGLPLLGGTLLSDYYVATGHYRNGILLAPITAKLMTDCILHGVEPPKEFSIERFQNSTENSIQNHENHVER